MRDRELNFSDNFLLHAQAVTKEIMFRLGSKFMKIEDYKDPFAHYLSDGKENLTKINGKAYIQIRNITKCII